jgi:hypothetical protein
MEKFVIELNNKNRDLKEFRSSMTSFAHGVRNMLLDLYMAGFDFPVSISGTQAQIESFFKALQNEKRYMDAYMKYGLGDSRTMSNKGNLDKAVRGFESETGLRWPFKN